MPATTTKGNYQKKAAERKRFNLQFASNLRGVYGFFRENNATVNELPTKEEIAKFWRSIWGEKDFNLDA